MLGILSLDPSWSMSPTFPSPILSLSRPVNRSWPIASYLADCVYAHPRRHHGDIDISRPPREFVSLPLHSQVSRVSAIQTRFHRRCVSGLGSSKYILIPESRIPESPNPRIPRCNADPCQVWCWTAGSTWIFLSGPQLIQSPGWRHTEVCPRCSSRIIGAFFNIKQSIRSASVS